ncbi:MAG TPA: hypothetical protein VEB86_16360 [Chryseosolibacter sp.]|nr:hypothetical protein [Chryseosolibacter sp.]
MTLRILIFCCGVSVRLCAQVSIPDFLRSAERDPQVMTYREQSQFLGTKPYQLSPLQRLEFRTQNRELIGYQQEFGLRLSPANPWEVKHNKKYFQSYQSVVDLQGELALRDALVDRYHAVIYASYYAEVAGLARQRRKLVAGQLAILQQQSGSNFFDADDFVDLQIDLMDRTVEQEEAALAVLEQQHQIEKLYQKPTDTLNWTWGNLTDIRRLRTVVDSLSSVSVASVIRAYQKQRLELASNEYIVEKANINAGFLQTEYDNRRQEQGRTPFNISLGITIPIVNPNKGDMTKSHLDVIEARHELDESDREEDLRITATIQRAGRLFDHYLVVEAKLAEYENSTLAGTLRAMEGGDPRIVLKFDENLVKLKLLLAKMRRDATLAYIDHLAARDLLQRRPLINFISPSLDVLE